MTISFEKSFGYMFKDPKWVSKLLILSLFSLLTCVVIGAPFLNGYVVRIMRWRLQGKEGLPTWDDLDGIFVDGLKVMVIGLGYALPIFVVTVGIAIITFIFGQNDDLAPFILILVLPFQGLVMLYSLAIMLVQPWTFYTVASGHPLSSAFHLRTYFKTVQHDWTNMIIALLFVWLVSSLSAFGLFVFLIGFFVALAYVMMVMGDIYGRLVTHWKTQGWLS